MKAVFADTFYWAALTALDDPAHAQAIALSRSLAPDTIVTMDEVLGEYSRFLQASDPASGIGWPGTSPN